MEMDTSTFHAKDFEPFKGKGKKHMKVFRKMLKDRRLKLISKMSKRHMTQVVSIPGETSS